MLAQAAKIPNASDIWSRLTTDYPAHRLSPYPGIPGTIKKMRELAIGTRGEGSPEIIHLVRNEIIRGVKAKDYVAELAAVYFWTCCFYRYTRDPVHYEYVEDPLAFWKRGLTSDCDDVAVWLAACAQILGNATRFVTVGFKNTPQPEFTHVYTEAYINRLGQWVVLDPVAGPMTKAMQAATVWRGNYPLDGDMGKIDIFKPNRWAA